MGAIFHEVEKVGLVMADTKNTAGKHSSENIIQKPMNGK